MANGKYTQQTAEQRHELVRQIASALGAEWTYRNPSTDGDLAHWAEIVHRDGYSLSVTSQYPPTRYISSETSQRIIILVIRKNGRSSTLILQRQPIRLQRTSRVDSYLSICRCGQRQPRPNASVRTTQAHKAHCPMKSSPCFLREWRDVGTVSAKTTRTSVFI